MTSPSRLGETMRTSREGLFLVVAGKGLIKLAAGHHDELQRAPDRRAVRQREEHRAAASVKGKGLEQGPGARCDPHRAFVEIVGAGGERDRGIGMGNPARLFPRRDHDLRPVGAHGRPQPRERVELGNVREREHGAEVDEGGEHEPAESREEKTRAEVHLRLPRPSRRAEPMACAITASTPAARSPGGRSDRAPPSSPRRGCRRASTPGARGRLLPSGSNCRCAPRARW